MTKLLNPNYLYKVGDHVLIRSNRPLAKGVPHKISPKYVGPYEIIAINGPVLTIKPVYRSQTDASQEAVRSYAIHKDRVRRCDKAFPDTFLPGSSVTRFYYHRWIPILMMRCLIRPTKGVILYLSVMMNIV